VLTAEMLLGDELVQEQIPAIPSSCRNILAQLFFFSADD
jgi:hypothetical protein